MADIEAFVPEKRIGRTMSDTSQNATGGGSAGSDADADR